MAYKKQAPSTGFQLLPDGWYEAFISAVDPMEKYYDNKNGVSGYKSIFNVKIREDLHPDWKGTELRFNMIADTPNFRWLTDQILDAVGVEDGEEFEDLNDILKRIKHQPIRIQVATPGPSQTVFNRNRPATNTGTVIDTIPHKVLIRM